MWHWDQGHLEYFQFDKIQKIALAATKHDFCSTDRNVLQSETGLSFSAPAGYSPWRNYSRALRLCLLVNMQGKTAVPTPVAEVLSTPGKITSDEYFHFLACAFTEPSPALRDWKPDAIVRYPLLFALRYLLAKVATVRGNSAAIEEIIGAYGASGFRGDEDQEHFIRLLGELASNPPRLERDVRQARESLLVLAQISYLHVSGGEILISLHPDDAMDAFNDLHPIEGSRAANRETEISRLASFFQGGSTCTFFDYPHTIVSEVEESGFSEGTKAKKTHIVIERNSALIRDFFKHNSTCICDICRMNTRKSYPWAERIIDVHHLLPLSCGTRVEATGTVLSDLVPVCPSCHRATHRFYDAWLRTKGYLDFPGKEEARNAYLELKSTFAGIHHAS